MRMTFYDLGGSPSDENCAATGKTEGYEELNKLECAAYILALKKKYGEPPNGCRFKTHKNPHDFGTYYTVRLYLDETVEGTCQYADQVSEELARWADVNFWPPVLYNGKSQMVHVIVDPALLDRDVHPQPPHSQHEQLGLQPGEFV